MSIKNNLDQNTDIKLQPSNRLEWVDYAKGIAIILVVYRHILIGVQRSGLYVEDWLVNANEIVYSFRMPLFFVLSGLFVVKSISKRNTLKLFSKYKFNTILYPYLIWGVIQLSIQVILSQYTNAVRDITDYVKLLIQPRAIDQLWYLYALFNVSILFYVLHKVFKISNLFLLIISLSLFGLSTFVKEYSLIHDTFYFLIFFVLGHLAKDFLTNPSNYNLFHSFKPFLFLFPFFWMTQYYWLFHQEMNIYFFGFISVLGTAFVFSISFLLAKYRIGHFLAVVGKHSLHIYLMHLLIVSAVRICLVRFLKIDSPEIILSTGWVLGVVLPIFIYNQLKNTYFRKLFVLD